MRDDRFDDRRGHRHGPPPWAAGATEGAAGWEGEGGPPWAGGRGGRPPWADRTGEGFPTRGRRGRRSFGSDDFAGAASYRRGARVGRGDVRAAILGLLAEEPMHGYQVIQELANRTGGMWKASPGSVYPTLRYLEEEGLVTGEDVEGRRVFSLTDAGRAAAATRSAGRRPPWERVGADADGSVVDLRSVVGQVAAAVRQVVRAGSAAQVQAAEALLKETRRSLYRILAEDAEDADARVDAPVDDAPTPDAEDTPLRHGGGAVPGVRAGAGPSAVRVPLGNQESVFRGTERQESP